MTEKLYKNKEWLQEKIKNIGNLHKIGLLCGVSGDTIEYWRKKLGIPHCIKFNRKYSVNESYFEKIDTEDKAYWLGFIMADGCISKNKKTKNSYRFSIILKQSDINHLVKASNAFSSNSPILTRTIYDKRGFENSNAELRINNINFCKNIMSLGIVKNKTGKEYIPNIEDGLKRHFIRGYFDGDGCISKSSHRDYYKFSICSASLYLLEQIQEFFIDNGIPKISIYKRNTKTPFYVLESNSKKILQAY